MREYCGNRSCSVVLRRGNCNGRPLAKLLDLEPRLSRLAGS